MRSAHAPLRTLALAALVSAAGGCALIGPYPYPDRSYPAPVDPTYRSQAFVAAPDTVERHICHLRTTRTTKLLLTGRFTGSAALVEGRYLVTAAHNVADYAVSWLQYVQVSCGAAVAGWSTVDVALDRPGVRRRRSVPRYAYKVLRDAPKFEYDFAFVDLGRTIEDGSRGFVVDSTVRPRLDETVFLGGYPGDDISSGDSLHVGTGRVKELAGNLITYDIDTATGNSGGPVWIVRDGVPYLIAIHVKENTGRLLNDGFHREWAAWRARIGAR